MHCQVWGLLCGSLATWNCVCGCIGYIDPQASLGTPSHPKPWWSFSGIICQLPRQNARVQDHFHVSFPAGTSLFSPRAQHPPFFRRPRLLFPGSLQWSITVVQFPIWPWLARIKLCMYFVWHRFYIVMMSYAKRKKINEIVNFIVLMCMHV